MWVTFSGAEMNLAVVFLIAVFGAFAGAVAASIVLVAAVGHFVQKGLQDAPGRALVDVSGKAQGTATAGSMKADGEVELAGKLALERLQDIDRTKRMPIGDHYPAPRAQAHLMSHPAANDATYRRPCAACERIRRFFFLPPG